MSDCSVILFKTGYSFISQPVRLGQEAAPGKEGEVEEVRVGPLPAFAVHGSLGLRPWDSSQVEVLSLGRRARQHLELALPAEDLSMGGFLEANLGAEVRVGVEEGQGLRGGSTYVQGRVKWVQPLTGGGARLALLQVREGQGRKDKLIDCSKLINVERMEEDEESVELVARFRRLATTKAPMASLSYLTRGLAWTPTYSLLLCREEMTLQLEGLATFLCDLPLFSGSPVASVSLVAERPRVQLEELCDPLVSGEGAMDFVRQLAHLTGQPRPPPPQQPRMQARMMKCAAPGSMAPQSFGFGAASEESYSVSQAVEGVQGGEAVEDFFHYQLQAVPLKHKEPVKMPFIKQSGHIKYEDIYFIDLDNKVRVASSGEDEESSVEVKHAVSFQNTTGQPLTSGPVSVLASEKEGQGRFMVQAMLKFSPPGKPVIVEISKSQDVQAKFVVETGSDRKTEMISKAVSWTGAGKKYVDIICKKGRLTVKNPKTTAINCKIEHALTGHLEKSSPPVKEVTERQSGYHEELNPTSKLLWEVSVPAEGTAELTIEYGIKVWK